MTNRLHSDLNYLRVRHDSTLILECEVLEGIGDFTGVRCPAKPNPSL